MSARVRNRVEAVVVTKKHEVLLGKGSFTSRRKLLRRTEFEASHRAGQHGRVRQTEHTDSRCAYSGKETAQRRKTEKTAPVQAGWI
jgi:hypothetical protein